MHYLFVVNTPAHVHTYKNVVDRLEQRGHEVLVLARAYACTVELCEAFEFPFVVYGSHSTERYRAHQFVAELPGQLRSLFRQARQFDPDVLFGRGPYVAWAGTVTGGTTICLLDSEPGQLAHTLSARVADTVLTPDSFRGSLGANHYVFRGLKECAYLHPEEFEPDPTVRSDLGVGPEESYAVVRFNAFDAFHDMTERGLTEEQKRSLLERLAQETTVFVSQEGTGIDFERSSASEYDLPAARMHDVLAEAALVVTETGTMATEAALLGTPVIGCGAFADWEFGEFTRLEEAGLLRVTRQPDETVATARRLLEDPTASDEWHRRREQFFDAHSNLTELLLTIAQQPNDVSTIATVDRPGAENTDEPSRALLARSER